MKYTDKQPYHNDKKDFKKSNINLTKDAKIKESKIDEIILNKTRSNMVHSCNNNINKFPPRQPKVSQGDNSNFISESPRPTYNSKSHLLHTERFLVENSVPSVKKDSHSNNTKVVFSNKPSGTYKIKNVSTVKNDLKNWSKSSSIAWSGDNSTSSSFDQKNKKLWKTKNVDVSNIKKEFDSPAKNTNQITKQADITFKKPYDTAKQNFSRSSSSAIKDYNTNKTVQPISIISNGKNGTKNNYVTRDEGNMCNNSNINPTTKKHNNSSLPNSTIKLANTSKNAINIVSMKKKFKSSKKIKKIFTSNRNKIPATNTIRLDTVYKKYEYDEMLGDFNSIIRQIKKEKHKKRRKALIRKLFTASSILNTYSSYNNSKFKNTTLSNPKLKKKKNKVEYAKLEKICSNSYWINDRRWLELANNNNNFFDNTTKLFLTQQTKLAIFKEIWLNKVKRQQEKKSIIYYKIDKINLIYKNFINYFKKPILVSSSNLYDHKVACITNILKKTINNDNVLFVKSKLGGVYIKIILVDIKIDVVETITWYKSERKHSKDKHLHNIEIVGVSKQFNYAAIPLILMYSKVLSLLEIQISNLLKFAQIWIVRRLIFIYRKYYFKLKLAYSSNYSIFFQKGINRYRLNTPIIAINQSNLRFKTRIRPKQRYRNICKVLCKSPYILLQVVQKINYLRWFQQLLIGNPQFLKLETLDSLYLPTEYVLKKNLVNKKKRKIFIKNRFWSFSVAKKVEQLWKRYKRKITMIQIKPFKVYKKIIIRHNYKLSFIKTFSVDSRLNCYEKSFIQNKSNQLFWKPYYKNNKFFVILKSGYPNLLTFNNQRHYYLYPQVATNVTNVYHCINAKTIPWIIYIINFSVPLQWKVKIFNFAVLNFGQNIKEKVLRTKVDKNPRKVIRKKVFFILERVKAQHFFKKGYHIKNSVLGKIKWDYYKKNYRLRVQKRKIRYLIVKNRMITKNIYRSLKK